MVKLWICVALSVMALVSTTAAVPPPPQSQKANSSHRKVIVHLDNHQGNDAKVRATLDSIVKKAGSLEGVGVSKPRPYKIGAFNAVAVDVDDQLEKEIAQLDGVRSIEQEVIYKAFNVENPVPSWGIDRIDGRLDGAFNYPAQAGQGVDVYVVDTGINTAHQDFGGRATMVDMTGEGAYDGVGHGSHVSGTAAGASFGVAKNALIYGVKVLSGPQGQGSTSVILSGLEWVYNRASQSGRPSVVNMSLGGPRNGDSTEAATQQALAALQQIGVVVVVAAGNNNGDACDITPAYMPTVITVGATGSLNSQAYDAIAEYSNWGQCVNIFAPGSRILSAWNTGPASTNTDSGTSMATPHVTGVVATLLSEGVKPANILATLQQTAMRGYVQGALNGSPNLLLKL
ncbi:hypothetical protein RI367_004851 [Sorochytrium milnesiophthora]